jgi:hypothetical protein
MTEYSPDRWVVIKVTGSDNTSIYRILASWYGGYAGSDSWQLNSGITKVVDKGAYYDFHGRSGSLYKCHKQCYGMSAYTLGIYKSIISQIESTVFSLELIDEGVDFISIDYSQ